MSLFGNYFFIALIPVCVIVGFLLIWWFNPFNSPRLHWGADRCLIRLCELTGINYTIVEWALVSLNLDKYIRNDKAYILDYTRSIKDSGGRSYIYFDIDNCLPLTFFQTTKSIKSEAENGEVILGKDPNGNTTLKYTVKDGKPLLWYNPSALDARLFMQIFNDEVWSRIGRSKMEKYALYIIICLIILVIAIAGLSAWQINNLNQVNAELTKKIIELLGGPSVKGG
jgi:hypothetical protein